MQAIVNRVIHENPIKVDEKPKILSGKKQTTAVEDKYTI